MIVTFPDFFDDLSNRIPERLAKWITPAKPDPRAWAKILSLFLHNINQRPLTGILKEIHSGILNGGLKPKPPSNPKEFFQRIDAQKTDKNGQAWRKWLSNLIDLRYRLAFRGNWTSAIFKKQLELLSIPAELASQWSVPLASAIIHSFDVNSDAFDYKAKTEEDKNPLDNIPRTQRAIIEKGRRGRKPDQKIWARRDIVKRISKGNVGNFKKPELLTELFQELEAKKIPLPEFRLRPVGRPPETWSDLQSKPKTNPYHKRVITVLKRDLYPRKKEQSTTE